MAHKGVKPAAQPRTLRTKAEAHNALLDDPAYDTEAGVPAGAVGAGDQYDDQAKAALPPAEAGKAKPNAATPKPFK